MSKVIEVKNLVKVYGKLCAVNDISFNVEKGEVFGLLGENGAGKTTTLEMIEGLRKPTSGKIKVLSFDPRHEPEKLKESIGVQLQSSAYYAFLNLTEILDLFASFYQKNLNPKNLLKMVDLEDKAKSYIPNLSGGQKQRFSIVASLINDPEIVFLDEPTTGLDPLARRNLWEIISKIKAQGKTIVLTTHYMEEAEVLCDRVAIMDKGKILATDNTHKLVEQIQNPYRISFIVEKINSTKFSSLSKLGSVSNVGGKTNYFDMRIKDHGNLNKAIKIVEEMDPETITVGQATLEDVFIEITGKTIGED